MLYTTLKQLLPYIGLALLGVVGADLLADSELSQYRDVFSALIISLLLQPWVIYHLEN